MVGQAAEGDIVSVYSADGEYLAAGHYQIGSIAVRILSFCGDPSAPEFWFNAIESAYKVRRSVGLADGSSITNCYRLVHGEGDGLPGLIVDYYDGVEGSFCGKTYKYLYWGDYRYWMMDPTPEECDLINRCIIPDGERKPENFPNIIR